MFVGCLGTSDKFGLLHHGMHSRWGWDRAKETEEHLHQSD